MSLIAFLIILAVQGLIFGALARLALPGPDPMGIPMTIGVGIAGSFLGGLLTYLITGGRNAGGLLAAFVGSVLVVYLIRRGRGGGFIAPDSETESRRRNRRY